MSGPKDFAFVFIAERLAEIRQRHQAIRDARAAQVEAELAAARRRAVAERASQIAARKSAIATDLERAASKTRQELEQAKVAAARQPEVATVKNKLAAQMPSTDSNEDARTERQATVDGWSAALAQDSAVGTFAAAEFDQWKRRSEALKEARREDFIAAADALAIDAKAIHERAGDIQSRFDVRNELLRDVIESMKEMGYFVSDPYFANPADPASPAVLKATCGSEVVTTSVDLTSMVRSVWDGQEHEHCKNSFFDFMKSMKSRGVTVTPERLDLREPPVLKQKGANELPRSDTKGRQAGA